MNLDSELTFTCEGGGLPIVLHPHWPGGCSGVTIGPGYDLGHRSAAEARADLEAAGVSPGVALQLAGGVLLIGEAAGRWTAAHHDLSITPQQSRALFDRIYPMYVSRAAAIVRGWGGHWDAFPPRAQEVLVDMAYRGDLSARHADVLLPPLMNDDPTAFADAIRNLEYWQKSCPELPRMHDGSPNARFAARAAWISRAS